MFSLSFSFFVNFYFAFFLFSCVNLENFIKNDQKKEKIPDIALRKNYLRSLLRHYAKELFAPDERFIYTTMRKNYLRSQHSLDIF